MSTSESQKKLYALRYSHSQNAFHQSTLQSAINDGVNSLRGHRPPSDWIIVGVATTLDELRNIGQQLRSEESGILPKPNRLPAEE
jgi:hypothetical protein